MDITNPLKAKTMIHKCGGKMGFSENNGRIRSPFKPVNKNTGSDTGFTQYPIRLLILGMAFLNLLLGLGTALVRLGWEVPLPDYDALIAHGSLMVCGFLGTLISMERAVAFGRPWAYSAPLFTAAGGIYLGLQPEAIPAMALTILGSLGLVILSTRFIRRSPRLSTSCLVLGSVCWLSGNVFWFAGWPLYTVVPWWIGFLLMTIAGERFELNRFLGLNWKIRSINGVSITIFLTGVCLTAVGFVVQRDARIISTEKGDFFTAEPFDLGARMIGIGLIGLSAWFLRHDMARRSVHLPGLTRFTGICLLSGYAWLGFCGFLGLYYGGLVGGPLYDAFLHAFFLGFVFAMIFGHAPIIFPAVLGISLRFRRTFYAHLLLLHLTLGFRIISDLTYWLPGRKWGGLLNALVLLIFFVNTRFAVQKTSVTGQLVAPEETGFRSKERAVIS